MSEATGQTLPESLSGDLKDGRAKGQILSPGPIEAPRNSGRDGRIAYLDGWRGIAILLVLVGHFFPVPGIDLGRLGVDWFLVLSGLLMARLLFVHEQAIGLFYKRRVSRIVPACYAFLSLLLLWAYVTGHAINARVLWSCYFFVRNYVWPMGPDGTATGHIWSLAVEEQCYVVLSLLAIVARRSRLRAPVLLCLPVLTCTAAILYYQMSSSNAFALYKASLHLEYAGYGIFASALVALSLGPGRASACAIVPILIAAGSLARWWSVPPALQAIAGVGALALAVNLLAGAPQWMLKALSFGPLRTLGMYSFSIYLWQQPFYASNLPRPVALACALITGVLSFYCLEQPTRSWLNRNWAVSAPRQK